MELQESRVSSRAPQLMRLLLRASSAQAESGGAEGREGDWEEEAAPRRKSQGIGEERAGKVAESELHEENEDAADVGETVRGPIQSEPVAAVIEVPGESVTPRMIMARRFEHGMLWDDEASPADVGAAAANSADTGVDPDHDVPIVADLLKDREISPDSFKEYNKKVERMNDVFVGFECTDWYVSFGRWLWLRRWQKLNRRRVSYCPRKTPRLEVKERSEDGAGLLGAEM
jgi:hypothetical protein